MEVIGANGTTWTVVRAYNGTIAAAHANGANVLPTWLTVGSTSNFLNASGTPATPFIVQVGAGTPAATPAVSTTLNGAVTAAATTLNVTINAAFPATPFAIQVDNEQMLVTNVSQTTMSQIGGISATATTMTVTSSGGFPPTPFVVRGSVTSKCS